MTAGCDGRNKSQLCPLPPKAGWQKLWKARKDWTQTKILGPNIRYFVIVVLRFVAIYAIFCGLWAKKSALWGQKQCFLSKKCTITWYILHILLS